MPVGTRQPAVAGRFYPGTPADLDAALDGLFPLARRPISRPALGVMVPHAGWVYSGGIAAATYQRVTIPRRVIVLCPNHTGRGHRRSVWVRGSWQLPGGAVAIAEDLADRIVRAARLEADQAAHLAEHAIEVQLPMLRRLQPELECVPICLAGLDYDDCLEIGRGLAQVLREAKDDILIVASTDMSHFLNADESRRLDHLALERVLELDPRGLFDTVTEHRISMCGYLPTTTALIAMEQLGVTEAELVRYGNSGEINGDLERVVGYAGVLFH